MKSISTVGVVALSLPTVGEREERVRAAISALEKEGIAVLIGSSAFRRRSYRSSDIRTRVDDVMRFFSDTSVDCILSTTGGFNSNELLEYLDYSIIRENPKPFVGYSDITAMNLGLYARAGLSTVNGPMLVDYVDDPSVFKRLFANLSSQTPDFTVPDHIWEWNEKNKRPCPPMRCLPGKKPEAHGRVIAGNLSTFVLLLGTPYIPDCTNAVLFLEYDECETDGLASLQRMLWQVRQSGLFSKIAGLVIGILPAATKKEEREEWALADILKEVTVDVDFPVIFDAPFGHLYPSWFLINGGSVQLKASNDSVKILPTPIDLID